MSREIILVFLILCIIIGILFLIKGNSVKKKEQKKPVKNIFTFQSLDKNLDSNQLKEEAFLLYKKLQTAKTKKDLKTLKEILSENLYLKEEQKLNEIKDKGYKIVATNIKEKNSEVLFSKKEKNKIKAIVFLHVSQYDYMIDKKKQVVRGTDETEYQKEYKMTIEKENDNNFKITKKECTGKWIKN